MTIVLIHSATLILQLMNHKISAYNFFKLLLEWGGKKVFLFFPAYSCLTKKPKARAEENAINYKPKCEKRSCLKFSK